MRIDTKIEPGRVGNCNKKLQALARMKKDIQDCQRNHAGTFEPSVEISPASQAQRLEYLVDMLKQLQLQANECRAETLSYVIGLAILEGSEQLNLCNYTLDLEQEILSTPNFDTAWKLKA